MPTPKSRGHCETTGSEKNKKMKLREPLPWISIKYKLPLSFILVCLVSLGAAGIVGYQATHDILRDEVQRDLLTISQNRAEKVVAYLDMLKKRTEDFSADLFILDSHKFF